MPRHRLEPSARPARRRRAATGAAALALAVLWLGMAGAALAGSHEQAHRGAQAVFRIAVQVRDSASLSEPMPVDRASLARRLGGLEDARITASGYRFTPCRVCMPVVQFRQSRVMASNGHAGPVPVRLFALRAGPEAGRAEYVIGGYLAAASRHTPGTYRGQATVDILFQ